MHVYDAELLRVRAHTYTNLDAAPPAFTPPANWPAARARRCSNCVPPPLISSHAASPPVPHSLTLSASSPPTTYCRNWRSPRDTGFTLTEERVAIPGEGVAYAGSKPLCQRASTDLVRGVFCVSARITAPMDRTADKRDVALRLRSQLKDVRVCLRLGLPARYLRAYRPGADGGDRRLGSSIGAYVGLVPCEYSTGTSRVQGSITKVGNTHVRRLLIEAAWHHRKSYRTSGPTLRARWAVAEPALRARGHAGNRRLYKRWRHFTERGKNPLVANLAIARELAGWCWSLATM